MRWQEWMIWRSDQPEQEPKMNQLWREGDHPRRLAFDDDSWIIVERDDLVLVMLADPPLKRVLIWAFIPVEEA